MKNKLDGVEGILLMGPGSSCIHDSVYEALGLKILGHICKKVQAPLKGFLQRRPVCFSLF